MQRCYGKVPDRFWLSPVGILYFTTFWVAPVMLHPQCLDFKPPFRPLRELEFCVSYKDFGCCDYQKDQELMTKYYQIVNRLDYYRYTTCAGFVMELLCQVGMSGLFALLQSASIKVIQQNTGRYIIRRRNKSRRIIISSSRFT